MTILVAGAAILFLVCGTALAYVMGATSVLTYLAAGKAPYLAVLP